MRKLKESRALPNTKSKPECFCPFTNISKGGNSMFSKLKLSFSNINYKLYFALLVLGFASTIYTTVRIYFLGSLRGEYSF
jgi:hypothetical protein